MPSRKSTARKKEAGPQATPLRKSSRILHRESSQKHDCQACQENDEKPSAKKRKGGAKPKNAKPEPKESPRRSQTSPDTTQPTSQQASYSCQQESFAQNNATATKPEADAQPAKMTVSFQFRQQGNVIYKKAFQEGIPSVIKMSRLEDAQRLYRRALSMADGPNKLTDWSSALKNCGMVAKRMAQEVSLQSGNDTKVLGLFKESLKQMSQALNGGGVAQGEVWTTKLREEMEASYYEVLEMTNSISDKKEKLLELYQVTSFLPRGTVLAGANYHIADILFKESVRFLERGDYKQSLNCLHDIHQPVEEALGMLREANQADLDFEAKELQLDLRVIQRDTVFHISTAEALQARKCGKKLLKKVLESEEFVNMDLVWNVVDWFKQATLKAAELDLEQEAAALSYLGLINQKILFSNTKAKGYYKKCLELAEAAKPKTFTSRKWYKQCVTGFQRIQDIERQRDEAAQQKIRQKILDTLKTEIAALEKANTCGSSLLEHAYKHHCPPKDPKFTKEHMKELKTKEKESQDYENKRDCKKLLLKACQDFHPDKFCKKEKETEEASARRKVLMEEITKMIIKYYEQVKLC